jgi:signal recognition particle receptor subunit beta
VFTAASSCPEQAWKRLAGESSAWVLLANANDGDSLRSTKADLDFVKGLGDVPMVVAAYVSMADDELTIKQITKALGLNAKTPVIPCHLRDRESVTGVVKAALDLAAASGGK